jgi:hypothetical protein
MFFFLMAVLLNVQPTHAQGNQKDKENKKENATKALLDSKVYVFKAESAMPLGGRVIQLTSDYDLKISHDTLVSYLPYYGRAYTAPVYPTEGGYQFTSTRFDYDIQPGKKGGWNIVIHPKDVREVDQIILTVSEKGYSSAQVTSNNRQPIYFNGYVTEARRSKKK